ncbi:MAG: triose-phosphate isomerase [Pseudomonadales bacterium]|jgi:triosephosphate isomerase|nr:triose-phosphate isomerase [Pseudomonadales bacterium]
MKYIIGNWKANQDLNSTREYLGEWARLVAEKPLPSEALVAIAPPTALYPIFLAKIKELNLPILPALQDISQFGTGTYTGETVLENLVGMEPNMVIVGHSERRKNNGENDEAVAKKVDLLLSKQIVPIVCVDEEYIESQAKLIKPEHYDKLLIAYEPVSAISAGFGTAKDINPEQFVPVLEKVRAAFPGCRVIYGGSTAPDNVKGCFEVCDGVLVGGSSLNAEAFYKMAAQV